MTNEEIRIKLDQVEAEVRHIKSMLTEPKVRRARVKNKSTKHFDKYLLK